MKLYLIAGEISGDLHGSSLVKALRHKQEGISFRGMGGDRMEESGVLISKHIRDTSFMGFLEVVSNLGKIRRMFREIKADILAFKPDAVILIDYPGFNLRMAKFIHEVGIKVIYYISPQVWAWKENRVNKIRDYVDRMLVILPFEKAFYQKHNIEVDFVGHPLLDIIDQKLEAGVELKKELLGDKKGIVALLPGSRKQEISKMLPVMLKVVSRFPEYQFVIAAAPSQASEYYQEIAGNVSVKIVSNKTYELLSAADFALVTSGTATLETALFEVPEVICYAGSAVSVAIARKLIKVKYIGLANLIMDREIFKELIQDQFNENNLEMELNKLMTDEELKSIMKENFKELKIKLGDKGASDRAAEAIIAVLKG